MNNFQDKANFVWQVADDILRGTFKQYEYGDVILPFVVLWRLDCVLNGKKDDVIKAYEEFKDKMPDPSAVYLQDFVHTKLDLYKKLSDPKVTPVLKSAQVEMVRRVFA